MGILPRRLTTTLAYIGIVSGLLVVVGLVRLTPVFAAAGDSPGDPIVITSCEELQAIDADQANYSKHYALGNDIDCIDSAGWDENRGFDPIASDSIPFTGTFNGNHHTITNLTINRANDTPGNQSEDDEQSIGLFAWTQDAEVYDVNIDVSKVKGYAYVGGVVGWAEDTILTNVSFNATVADNSCDPGHCVWARYGFVGGGIVGMLHNSQIINGVSGGPAKGSGNTIGGLAGQVGANSSITSSSSSSNIDGGNNLGGAVGSMLGGDLVDVHATGSIDANDDEDMKNGYAAGGLVGYMEGAATITRSSATGNVHADWSAVGGLVGFKQGTGNITDSYARGDVTQADGWTTGGKVGGLIGELRGGTIERTYASGSTTGEYAIGGLVGQVSEDAPVAINNSFAAGAVSQTGPEEESRDGGLIGYYDPGMELDNNYYDADHTGMDHCLAGYPEGYWESPASTGGCTAINEDGENGSYFYVNTNQPFDDGEVARWTSEVWDFHEDDYPTFACDQCEVIEESEEPDAAATLETLQVEDIAATTAVMHGQAQLHNGVTIEDVSGTLLVGFHLNTNSTVDWDHFTHSAPVANVTTIESDDTHIAFNGEITGLQCETQYWYVAAYTYNTGEGYESGIADNVETFTTAACPASDDNDGVSTEVENAAPNDGDANNDGTPDSEQDNVASFVNSKTEQYVTVVVDEDCVLTSVSASEEDTNWAKDSNYVYNSGFINFTADCGEDGFTTPVAIYYFGTNKEGLRVRKYNPTTQAYTNVSDITDVSLDQQTIGGQSVAVASYNVADGGELDTDGDANGTIVDPVGLASAPSNTQDSNDNLAATGQSAALYIVLAGLLLSGGAVLIIVRRKRHRS